MDRLRREVDQYLMDWKNSSNKMPLLIIDKKISKKCL